MLEHKILLASGSPRRKELLLAAGFDVRVEVAPIEETWPSDTPMYWVAAYLAEQKAAAAFSLLQPNEIMICADTVVMQELQIINKPADAAEAKLFLQRLSGKKHTVVTGVCIQSNTAKRVFSDRTQVWFDTLTEAEIDFYIQKFQPLDKAGAYGIQEWIGLCRIKKVTGSYTNIMGLPVNRVYNTLVKYF